jgi:hypothetical protein
MDWTNVTIKLNDLEPWERNPKFISKANAKRLLAGWQKWGQFEDIQIGPQQANGLYPLYNGHQRLSTLKAAFGGNYEIKAKVSSRVLTEKEKEEFTINAHYGSVGALNWNELSSWGNEEELQAWGLDSDTLRQWQEDTGALGLMLDANKEVPDFQEYDEDVANDVEMIECPHCGATFPK